MKPSYYRQAIKNLDWAADHDSDDESQGTLFATAKDSSDESEE